MVLPLEQTALMLYLHQRSPSYYAKLLEIRESIRGWLAYIPHTFPHYTRHTIEHSEEIIRQVSFILFADGDPNRPALTSISNIELYILAAAALFHDCGMVASDSEKRMILESSAWKDWTTKGGGSRRWEEIQAFRVGNTPTDESTRHFIADVQTRFLLAEFIRRTHHQRTGKVITEHQAGLGRFAFDDRELARTIADVCESHGLRQHELEDTVRYPDRRNLRGEVANVRFVAILLRLGDLLDTSFDRACPLLLNAACPLPADSFAHWTQFDRITHRLTAPDRIEISALCETQDEHRVLQDWHSWLVEEVREAEIAMLRTARHRGWKPPYVAIEGKDPTITIRPSPSARYFPYDWIFELDREAVFDRLIRDAYEDSTAFVRELIQNAADATRCKLYLDAASDGIQAPEFPTQFEEHYREQYLIEIQLSETQRKNSLSGEEEVRQKIVVEDSGIGMDEEVIRRYFLQVGRSFYTTDDFRRNFKFVPTSRFGIGFLSTFAVSDEVVVESYKPSSSGHSIRLKLHGPRSYLLTERGERQRSGTRIEVLLKEPMQQGELTTLLKGLCKRLEFPVVVNDLGKVTTIRSESPSDFVREVPEISDEGNSFKIQSFPVNKPGIEGELYVFVRATSKGDSWADFPWAKYSYLNNFPQAAIPVLPESSTCFHGLEISRGGMSSGFSARLDYRGEKHRTQLSRSQLKRSGDGFGTEIDRRWDELLEEHLAQRNYGDWRYCQRLIDDIGTWDFWLRCQGTVRVYLGGQEKLLALSDLNDLSTIATATYLNERRDHPRAKADDFAWADETPTLVGSDLSKLADRVRDFIFQRKQPVRITLSGPRCAICYWDTTDNVDRTVVIDRTRFAFLPLEKKELVGFSIPTTDYRGTLIVNTENPLGAWLWAVAQARGQRAQSVEETQFERLMKKVETPIVWEGLEAEELNRFVEAWRRLPELPAELYPPLGEISASMFRDENSFRFPIRADSQDE